MSGSVPATAATIGQDWIVLALLAALALAGVALGALFFGCVSLVCCGRRKAPLWMAVAAAYLALMVGVTQLVVPSAVDRALNGFVAQRFPAVSERAVKLHASLSVADLHADSLMWPSRDLLRRNDFAHVDVPRLLAGRVALQAFTLVTSVPLGLNFNDNPEPTGVKDQLLLKAVVENWAGAAVISSVRARAAFQIDQLEAFEARSNGTLHIVRTKSDLENVLKLHAGGQPVVGGLLGVEGLHCLDSRVENVGYLHARGVRMAALTHFFDNSLGGSAHGLAKGGITPLGRAVVAEMARLGMLVDVAHNSHKLIADLIEIARHQSPGLILMTSHTGVQAVCDAYERNLSDDELRAIAATGGVVGVAFFAPCVCGSDLLASILDTIDHVRSVVGIDHVALGSDWDGTVKVPFDAANTVHVTNGLLARNYTDADVRAVMGGNTFRMLRRVLPG